MDLCVNVVKSFHQLQVISDTHQTCYLLQHLQNLDKLWSIQLHFLYLFITVLIIIFHLIIPQSFATHCYMICVNFLRNIALISSSNDKHFSVVTLVVKNWVKFLNSELCWHLLVILSTWEKLHFLKRVTNLYWLPLFQENLSYLTLKSLISFLIIEALVFPSTRYATYLTRYYPNANFNL